MSIAQKKRFPIPQLNESIDKYGWIITGVPGGAIYTVGMLDKFGHPELMIHGLPPIKADHILREAVRRLVEGHSFQVPNELHDQVVKDYQVKSIAVDTSNFNDWLGQAAEYHGEDLDAVQLLWPDKSRRYPGDEGYDPMYATQKRFDVRRPEYDQIEEVHVPGDDCSLCNKPL